MNGESSSRVSSYIQYLPAILQADTFLSKFLLGFERILNGLEFTDDKEPNSQQPSLEEYIDNLHTYFRPGTSTEDRNTAPAEFLPWLANWVALSLRDDWSEDLQRNFISKVVPLYRFRGTKQGLENILEIYLQSSGFSEVSQKAKVYDQFENIPHYFQVELTLPNPDLDNYWRQLRIAKAIIDQEKPAHTYYALKILVPTMRLTGGFYPINIDKPGKITATITTNEANSKFVLSLKSSTQPEPLAREISSNNSFSLEYDISNEQINQNHKFHITIANLSDTTIEGSISININFIDNSNPQELLSNQNFKLPPALKIGKPPNGNTLLGTVSGKSNNTN